MIRLLTATAFWLCLTSLDPFTTQAAASESPRQDIPLNTGWKFQHAELTGAEAVGRDDASWESVSIPHCWDVELGQTGQKKAWESSIATPAWYRLRFTPAAGLAGKSLFLKFDGIYVIANVYLNGQPLGDHIGGFTAFGFEVTPRLQLGRENILAVKVTGKSAHGLTPPNNTGDFTRFPGIYRSIHLLALDPVSITPLDDGANGVYLKQVKVNDDSAQLEVTTKLRNGHDHASKPQLRCRILNHEGQEIQTATTETTLPAGGSADVQQSIRIEKPHLWNGSLDPYLYRAEIEVTDGGKVTDRIEEPLGLRYFHCDPAKGFFLNGKPYAVHGVNRHQDFYNKGWAIGSKELETDVALLLEMGCTGVRLAHYPHCRLMHSLCDQAGLLVWSESPMVNAVIASSPEFGPNTLRQVNEWVKQNFNHPSIFLWSLGNEWVMKNSEPGQVELIKQINDRIKQLDPTRLTSEANCGTDPASYAASAIPDVVSWNFYPGWYGAAGPKHKTFEEQYQIARNGWNQRFELSAKQFPGRCVGVSEYGAGSSLQHHMLNPLAVKTDGPFHPEEWQLIVHEANYAQFLEHPELCWIFTWVFADFSSYGRHEGDQPGRNDKGLISYDRQTKKDIFYFYQAQWSRQPMVHITGRRYTPHPAAPTEVKVYSNCDRVELSLNGQPQGQRTREAGVCRWPVTLTTGEARLEAVAIKGDRQFKDAIQWTCTAEAPLRMGEPAPEKPAGTH